MWRLDFWLLLRGLNYDVGADKSGGPAASSLLPFPVPSLPPLGFTRMEPLFFEPDKTAFVPQPVYFTSLAPAVLRS